MSAPFLKSRLWLLRPHYRPDAGTGNARTGRRRKFVSEVFFRGQKRFVFKAIKKNLGNEPNFPPAAMKTQSTGWKPLIPNDS